MTNLQNAASEFRKALAYADKAQSTPRPLIEVIEKGEALIEALEMAQNVPAATTCADHQAGETGYVTFNTKVTNGSQLFLAPPAQREAPVAEGVENVAADAYHHACSRMEEWHRKRARAGKEVGTEGSLCDGIEWLYQRIEQVEAKPAAVALAVPESVTLPLDLAKQIASELRHLIEKVYGKDRRQYDQEVEFVRRLDDALAAAKGKNNG